MKNIQKISHVLIVILNIMLVGMALLSLSWVFIDTAFIKFLYEGLFSLLDKLGMIWSYTISTEGRTVGFLRIENWNFIHRLIVAIGIIIGLIPYFLGTLSLKSIFKNYEKVEIFTKSNAILYRRLGILLFLKALVFEPISNMLTTLGVTFATPGQTVLKMSYGSPNIELIFYGFLVMVISWVMLEGCHIENESKFTI